MSDVGKEIPLASDVPIAARLLKVSEHHIRNMIARGELDAVRLGKLIRIPRASIERLLETVGNGAA